MSNPRGDSPLERPRLTTPRAGLIWILLLTAVAVTGLITVYDDTLLSNDTAQYLSVARHLANGEGQKTDLVFFSEHLALDSMPVEQTVFPPGYPWLISIPAKLGLSVRDAAFVVTASAFALVPLVLYLLGLSLGQPPGWALTGAIVWITVVDNWFITWERQSEMPFILFTLLALALIPRDQDDRSVRAWIAGAFAAAAILTRYSGIFLVIAVVAVLGLRWIRQRTSKSASRIAAFLVAPLMVTGWMFWRNLMLVGDIKGGNAYLEIKPLGLVVLKFYKSLCHILGFTGSGLRSLRTGELLLVASMLTVSMVWIWHRKSIQLRSPSQRLNLRDPRFSIAIAYMTISVVLLFYLELTTSLEFQPRMVLVLVPFFLVVSTQLLSLIEIESGRARSSILLLGILFGVTFIAGQRNVLQQMRSRPNLFLMVEEALSVDFDGTSAKERLDAEVSVEHALMGNEPQMLGAVLAAPVVGLEPPYYTDRNWTPDEVHDLARRYGVEYVALMPELLDASSERPEFFVRLENGEIPSWLEPVLVAPTLRLYRVQSSEPGER